MGQSSSEPSSIKCMARVSSLGTDPHCSQCTTIDFTTCSTVVCPMEPATGPIRRKKWATRIRFLGWDPRCIGRPPSQLHNRRGVCYSELGLLPTFYPHESACGGRRRNNLYQLPTSPHSLFSRVQGQILRHPTPTLYSLLVQ